MEHRGIQLNSDYSLAIRVTRQKGLITGGLVVGDTTDQVAAIALKARPGEVKEAPLIGAGLTKYTRGTYDKAQAEDKMREHLKRAGVDWESYKQRINTTIKTSEQ